MNCAGNCNDRSNASSQRRRTFWELATRQNHDRHPFNPARSFFFGRPINRRAHRLGKFLAISHPEWGFLI
jgi:hypothetical protein